MFGLRAPELLILMTVMVPVVGLPLFAAIHAALVPRQAWVAAGRSHLVWVVLLTACVVLPFGVFGAIAYLLMVLPQVAEARRTLERAGANAA